MREHTAKLLFIAGISVSFPLILGLMVALMGLPGAQPQPPRASTTAQPRIASRAGTPPRSPARSRPAGPAQARRDTASRHRPSGAPPDLPTSHAAVGAVAPDPATVEQLAILKRELGQQINSLKEDRDAMIAALARSLARLTPAEVAVHLAGMDADTAARALIHFREAGRQQVLAQMAAGPAQEVRRRLAQLGTPAP